MQYRERVYKTRQEELVIQAQEMEEELREKERRLESLRSLVRVEATVDPQRVLKETKVCVFIYRESDIESLAILYYI